VAVSLALYRKYRPATFAEVIGQEHVTEPLRNALRNGRISHAFLFSGPRGCGKTSMARILARSLNCAQGPTPAPCGECQSCQDLAPTGPGSLDVLEIDAASHGGVDDARDLRDRAFYAPVSSRYKVYVIDEAHMVSKEGFNALLKLVEEPPEFVTFVFATTEPEKVISTIRSRTHHYPFRLVPPSVLREHLAGICAREGVEVDPLVFPLVVRAAAGSVRDSLSVLDQLIGGAGADGVDYARAVALLGQTDAALLDEIVDALGTGDGAAVFEAVDRLVEGGADPRRFVADLLEHIRDLIVLRAVPDAGIKGLLDRPADQLERMAAQAARTGAAGLSRAADILSTGLTEMRGATAPRLLLELICARLLLPAATTDESSTLTRLERLERRLEVAPGPAASPGPSAEPVRSSARAPVSEVAAVRVVTPPEAVTGGVTMPAPVTEPTPPAPVSPVEEVAVGTLDAAALRRVWPDVLDAVRARKRGTWTLIAQYGQVAAVRGRVVTLTFGTPGIARSFAAGINIDILKESLHQVLGVDWDIECVVGEPPSETVAGGTRGSTVDSAGPGRPPAAAEGFADGDAAAEEPADGPDTPRLAGEDAAIALIREGLGGRVIG
jgi:DNA polymerase-3 subunit gamma/tau